ncbi:DUF1569 domain-containing protein [Dyadobacter sp. 3J3]|uniref:DUF1569 domain-containing protein n=1 Tax=Dyadobacter sp. 3J3 TaxID=2606600 RepID=UPI00135B3862|nr:DUF1569 domain-containing protein [Dyadobacter sp. 3J3]
MKTIFDRITREELITRIKTLNDNSLAQWGSMNVCQMLKHCILADELYLGRRHHKRVFLGLLIGKFALRHLLKNDDPMGKNAPTSDDFKIKEMDGDVSFEKEKWISVIEAYGSFSNLDFVHWFFGKMTKEQIGHLVYKHTDHHLRQFKA